MCCVPLWFACLFLLDTPKINEMTGKSGGAPQTAGEREFVWGYFSTGNFLGGGWETAKSNLDPVRVL